MVELVKLLEQAGVQFWIISLLTLAIFSFLYRDNPVYKLVEHVYVGIAAGYHLYQVFRNSIWPNLGAHLWDGIIAIQEGQEDAWHTQSRWGAFILGMLMLSRLVPRWAWVSRWPMALIVGAFAGLNLVGFAKSNLVDQIHGTMVPLAGNGMPFWPSLSQVTEASVVNNAILVSGVLLSLIYFFFSPGRGRTMTELGKLGISVIMITFGATYGSIVLARISLLIGRLQALQDANQPEHSYPAATSAVIIIAILAFWRLFIYKPEVDESAEPGTPESSKT